MKKIAKIFTTILIVSCSLTGCMKDTDETFYLDDYRIEFDEAVTNNNAFGLNYPLLSALRDNAGVVRYRINLIGGLKPTDESVQVSILATETTAVEGEHYQLPNGLQVIIPANSAFGYLEVAIPELSNTDAVRLVFELQSSEILHASANHKRIGLPIRR